MWIAQITQYYAAFNTDMVSLTDKTRPERVAPKSLVSEIMQYEMHCTCQQLYDLFDKPG